MQNEKIFGIIGWLFDQMSNTEDYMVTLFTTSPDISDEQGVANIYKANEGGHTHFASRIYSSGDLIKFGMWLFLFMGTERDVSFNPRRLQSTKGQLDLPGKTAYFWLQSYPKDEGWACDIHFSFQVKPSAAARNRMEATRIVREAKITADLSSDALMQVADALGSQTSREA